MKARDIVDAVRYWARWHPTVAWAIGGLVVGFLLGKLV